MVVSDEHNLCVDADVDSGRTDLTMICCANANIGEIDCRSTCRFQDETPLVNCKFLGVNYLDTAGSCTTIQFGEGMKCCIDMVKK